MKRWMKFPKLALLLAVSLALVISGVVLAITIAVDGDREAAWSGSGGQTPGIAGDLNEGAISDNVDIEIFQWTNDQTDFYFLVDVWAAAPLMPALAPINICLDADNNLATDIPVSNAIQRNRCSYPTGVSGIDTVVEAYRLGNGSLWVDVYNVAVDPQILLGAGTLGYNPSAATPVVEISVPVGLLGYGPGVCPATIPMVVYYDGGDTNPDDNLPDRGTASINCGLPTAVTFSVVDASSSFAAPVALVALGLVGALGVVVLSRRRKA